MSSDYNLVLEYYSIKNGGTMSAQTGEGIVNAFSGHCKDYRALKILCQPRL